MIRFVIVLPDQNWKPVNCSCSVLAGWQHLKFRLNIIEATPATNVFELHNGRNGYKILRERGIADI